MKRKIFSKLLMGALLVASVSSFTSCKDYDDDINSLKESVAKAALQSNLDALTTQVNGIKTTADQALTTANAAATKSELSAAKKEALDKAAEGITNAATAQEAADAAKTLAEEAKKAAESIDLSPYVTKTELAETAEAAKTEITNALADYWKAEKIEAALAALKQEVAEANEAQMTEMKTKVDNAVAGVQAIWNAVTSVELYYSDAKQASMDAIKTFKRVKEYTNEWPVKANAFPHEDSNADATYKFSNDRYYIGTTNVIVRVAPTTAVLTKENVSIINSQGAQFPTNLITVKNVEPYTDLLTRAGGNNGLWKITFELNDKYDVADFDKAAGTTLGAVHAGYEVLYAVAVNNTANVQGAENRSAVTSYDLNFRLGFYNHASLDYTTWIQGTEPVGTTNYNYARLGTLASSAVATAQNRYGTVTGVTEYKWKTTTTDAYKLNPCQWDGAVNATYSEDDTNDDRTAGSLITAKVGEKINIFIDYRGNKYDATDATKEATSTKPSSSVNNPIKGFYVTLDTPFAETTSSPSELNAWQSYEYENVGYKKLGTTWVPAKLQSGNKGSITVKNMNGVVGDIIGFRIYAINLDGTVVDPDGRAFYVQLGAAAEGNKTIEASIVATDAATATNNYTIIDVTDVFKTSDNAAVNPQTTAPYNAAWTWSSSNPARPTGATAANIFKVEYFKDARAIYPAGRVDEIKFAKVSLQDLPKYYADDQVYTQSLALSKTVNGVSTVVKTVTLKAKKVLPEFPAAFGFKSAVSHDGNAYTAFFSGKQLTAAYDNKVDYNPATYSADGQYNLETTFNGVAGDPKYTFTFAATDDGFNGWDKDADATTHILTAMTGYIDNATTHTMKVSYNYGAVSAYLKENNTWEQPTDYELAYPGGDFTVKYSCWHTAATFNAPSSQMEMTWGTPQVWVDLSNVVYNNTFNGVALGKNLGELIWNRFLSYQAGADVKFTIEGSSVVNEHLERATTITDAPVAAATKAVGAINNVSNINKLYRVEIIDELNAGGTAATKTHYEYRFYINQKNWTQVITDHTETCTITFKDVFGHNVPVQFPIHVKPAGM